MGLASAATTDGPSTPRYGLAYDLGSGQWVNAAQFQQFTRDVLPVTQQKAQAATQQLQAQSLHAQELERAQNYQDHGLFMTRAELGVDKSGIGNQIETGFKAAAGYAKNVLSDMAARPARGIPVVGGWLGALGVGQGPSGDDADLYAKYTKAGGLLTQDEFNSFNAETRHMLYDKAQSVKNMGTALGQPIIKQGVEGLGYAYRGTTTGVEMLGNPDQFTSTAKWAQAWREAQGQSLGNAIVNLALDPFYTKEQLDRMKRDNPWYQMTSFGTEFGATWYIDPLTVAGKGLGAAARFKTLQFPIREGSSYAIALRQATRGDRVTTANPLARGYAAVQARRIAVQWDHLKSAAQNMSAAEFAQLPMFSQRYRAVDGGAAAHALHWAANNEKMVNDAFGGQIDAWDLTQRLTMGDPHAYAMLQKLQMVPPAELQQLVPNGGSLLHTLDALKTRADVLQQETDDLLREADNIEAGTSTSKALPMFHRWEIHTSLADKQRQLAETTDALQRYAGTEDRLGYQDWLDLTTGPKGLPFAGLSRVQAPSKARWSQMRNLADDGSVEQRAAFQGDQFGPAHSFYRITKPLFLKRANAVEIHSLDSGIMSINRQFDQYEHLFGYAPEGARDAAITSYLKANSMYDRYKVLHDIEDTHLIGAIAQKFGIEGDMARAIVNRIHSERNATIQGILTGDGSVYRSAPTIADRAASGTDSTIQLVSRDAEAGTVRLKLMNGRHIQEFDVPDAALEKRAMPEDPTQTPNYYNPLDSRRLFHQLRHDPQMLQELNKGWLRDKAAAAVETGEYIGTKFNEFWKPVQLFRLGWPIRVLMDEGARATAIFGPMYWLTGPGKDAIGSAIYNLDAGVANFIARKRKGPLGIRMDEGPGPVADAAKQNPNGFVRDAEVRDAVQVPQSLWPKVDPARYEKIHGHYTTYDQWDRATTRARLWQDGEIGRLLSQRDLTPAQGRAVDYGLNAATFNKSMPDNPLFEALRNRGALLSRDAKRKAPQVIDMARGTKHNTGYVVPLPDTHIPTIVRRAGGRPDQINGRELMAWLDKHSELLSRSGMRLIVNPEGGIGVGRHFTANKFRDMQQFAQYVSEQHPGVEVWDLGRGHKMYVQDANDLSPISEQLNRIFYNEETKQFAPGEAPVEGSPAVFHGTDQTLPENLSPRHDVPVWNGRMVGSGLYTTTSKDIAESYGSTNLYTLRGSKSGRQYKVFDLDKPITQGQRNDLESWLRAHSDRFFSTDRERADAQIAEMMDAAENGLGYRGMTKAHEQVTWAHVYEKLANDAWMGTSDAYHNALHAYLEERHGAGALTHTGGTTHGHPHQVYIWLKPEDLLVKPAYAGTGEYHSLAAWFSHPDSIENLVPENRIIRKGIRNPMLRELRTIAHQIDNAPYGVANETRRGLLARERELMDALGLEHRGRNSLAVLDDEVSNALLPHRYVVRSRDHFERMVDEARTEDEARTLRAAANGDLRAQEVAASLDTSKMDMSNFDAQIDDPIGWLANQMKARREQGAGWKRIKTSDGRSVIVPAAFEGHAGELFRGLTASNGALDVLSEGHGQGMSLFRRKAAAYRVYNPPQFTDKALDFKTPEGKRAVRYFQVYADTVNDHLGNSPIIQRMISGQSNDQVINWLENTIEGQRILRDIKPKEMPTGIWVDDHRYKLNYYVPNPMLRRLLGKGRLKPSDFRKNIADEDLPTIYGPDLEVLDRNRGFGRFAGDLADKAWDYLGNKPIDAFSRHPFATAMYNAKMKNLIASTDSKLIKTVKIGDHNVEMLDPELMDLYVRQARQFALNETRRHLYNLTETTNFNDALRFVAPFWGAQYEAITKWLRIISDRPETVGRFFSTQRAVYNNFMVVDPTNNHQVVKSGTRPGGLHGLGLYHPQDMVIMQMPKWAQKKFGLQDIGSLGIPIGSANTVLQGDLPLLPSLGPLITIPADQFLRKVSDTYGVQNDQSLIYRWLFPIGRPRSKNGFSQMLDQFVPGWVNRVRQASGPEDSLSRINMEMLVGREMVLRNRRLGKPDPTPQQIEAAANHLWHVREIAGLIQPFQTQFLPEHQYWLDAWHKYQKQYGNQAWDKFVAKYGEEAAIYTTSSSNSVGVPPTDKGMEEWSKNKELIQKYPDWTSAIISPQAYMGQFSPDAYGQQFNITLGPGDTTTLRSGSSLQNRLFDDPETKLGWMEYRKINAGVEAELHARGLTSIQQAGAEDIALAKQLAKEDLAKKYPAWAQAFQQQSNDMYSQIKQLTELAGNPIFNNRPDWQGVRQYLQIRKQATDALDQYALQGGSRSLQSQENGALRDWFYNNVGQLILDNPAFAEFYTRYLDQDTLTMGSGF